MAIAPLLIAFALLAAPASGPEPLEDWTNIRIEQEVDGSCAVIRAGRSVDHPAMVMDGVCHGWQSETCGGRVWFRGEGVVQDQARVLFAQPDSALDVARLIDDEVARRWPGREVLRLAFERPSCGGEGLMVKFSGSHVAGEGGAAVDIAGEVRIAGPSDHVLALRKTR
ncbi:hypothetical protein AS593_09260 [Caulobacter vibrioides]|nr:hypothetical protein AS593_09260 [Caulobacter vibrioides]